MRTKMIFAALFIGLSVAACAPKAGAGVDGENGVAQSAKDFTPSKAQIDSVSYLIGINFGSFIKGYDFGDNLNYNEIVKGIKDFVAAKGDQQDPAFLDQFKISPELMNDVFNEYLSMRAQAVALENKEKGDAYLAANAKKSGVQQTESGLQYKIIEPGSDVKAGPTDTVWVRYKGSLIDGTVFDETPEGSEPIMLTLDRVIPGWTEGLQLVGEGGKIQLTIPGDLGYGEAGTRGIAPNSVLLFDVELVKIGNQE